MFTVRCYERHNIIDEQSFKDKEEAFLYAQIMFNSGYTKVEIYDQFMFLIETI